MRCQQNYFLPMGFRRPSSALSWYSSHRYEWVVVVVVVVIVVVVVVVVVCMGRRGSDVFLEVPMPVFAGEVGGGGGVLALGMVETTAMGIAAVLIITAK